MTLVYDGIEQQEVASFAEKSYLDYAMSVILDRALPHIADGLKPVQRRIIYAMSELGLRSTSKYKKSARTVGDVLGKYHPHGDSACYEAMVLMAQPFSYRYPLVDGQGNWGSQDDPKSFAAMRYTESRLSAFAQLLLAEVDQGTVAWVDNFDGTLTEPERLPAQVPHVLLNGTSGIAVGMATDIPPHNLNELVAACEYLLSHANAELDDILPLLPGPDYASGAELITPRAQLKHMYQTGTGSLKLRATYRVEQGHLVVINELPYQVSGAKLMVQLADQLQKKKLPMVVDLRDESDHEHPVRLVIELKNHRVDVDVVMSHLFASTDLEKSYRVNLNMIGLDGRPQVKPLLPLLREWLTYRQDTVVKRLQHRLQAVNDRLHILAGLLIAYLNIDEVIRIIREEDDPKVELIQRFELSERQADAILNLRLRHLAKLEEFQLQAEQNELAEEKASLELLLSSDRRLKTLLKKELKAAAKAQGDERRTLMIERSEAKLLQEDTLVPSETLTVVVSQNGWVRAAKGADVDPLSMNYKSGDAYLCHTLANSRQSVVFMDTHGRAYSMPAHQLPSARGQGEPLTSRFTLPEGASIQTVLAAEVDANLLLVASSGYGFIVQYAQLMSKNKAGKAVVNLGEHHQLLPPQRIEQQTHVSLLSDAPRLLTIALTDCPQLAKGKGNKLIQLSPEHQLMQATLCHAGDKLCAQINQQVKKLPPLVLEEALGKRAGRGVVLARNFAKATRLAVCDSAKSLA